MKKEWFIPLFCIILLFSCGWTKTPKYHLTICTMFKNEAPFLKEWIDFHHRAIGVSHFYLYNNDSTDHFREVLAPYIDQGLVELIEWETSDDHAIFGIDDETFVPYQIGAFRDCLKNRAYEEAEWVAIIDVDEYIVPGISAASFHNLLDKSKRAGIGSLKIRWKTFGTSNIKKLDPRKRLVEQLVCRAPDDYLRDVYWVKSIHQPKATASYCVVHETIGVEKGYWIHILPSKTCRIHHYWSRTEEQCNEKRHFNTPEEKESLLNTLNTIKDYSIYPHLMNLSEE